MSALKFVSKERLKSKPLIVLCVETKSKERSENLYCKAADLTVEKQSQQQLLNTQIMMMQQQQEQSRAMMALLEKLTNK